MCVLCKCYVCAMCVLCACYVRAICVLCAWYVLDVYALSWSYLKSVRNRKYIQEFAKKYINFTWEGRTSMSPRSNEITTFFQKWTMYNTFDKVFWRVLSLGLASFGGFLVKKSVRNRKGIRKSEKKKKWWFRVGGAHIDVTTLERNCYFFWKVAYV